LSGVRAGLQPWHGSSLRRRLRHLWLAWVIVMAGASAHSADLILDDRSSDGLQASHGGAWRLVTDQVMGGVSAGQLTADRNRGRACLRLRGEVSTANNGGFVQMALDLAGGEPFDASAYAGIALQVAGNGERYNLHLRTSSLWLPWQSYRASFVATPAWQEVKLPFSQLEPYRTTSRFRPDRLVRLGLVAIGRDFQADLCVGAVRLYRDAGAPAP
jgi:hypothetical protein